MKKIYILDSERIEECIDFIMMCTYIIFIFVSEDTSFSSKKNARVINSKRGF